MVNCLKCGKKLGLFFGQYRLDDGSVSCRSCFDKLKREEQEKNKRIMADYIAKYLSNKEMGFNGYILGCHKNKDINNLFYSNSLDNVIEHFQMLLEQTEYSNKSGMSSYEVDEIIDTKKMCEEILNFLDDLEKMYKLFSKKDIDADYFEILSIFAEVIERNINKEFDTILIPAYKRISKRLGKDITIENVVKEFMKIPLELEHDDFFTISKLLDKFNLKYDEGEVEEIIEKTKEEIGLEEFEQDLGSSQKIDIGDFEKLNGYEFEGYLKELFNRLGYITIQTSLSGDQGADLIISKDGEKTVVQAKKYAEKVSNKAVQEIVAAKNHYKAQKAIVVTNSSFTKSAIDLALSNNVDLWDGLKLKNIIQNLKSKKKGKGLQSLKSLSLKGREKVKDTGVLCPFCEEEFILEKNFIKKDVDSEIECPNCGSYLKISTKHSWHCNNCNKVFETEEESEKHEKTCKKKRS